MNNIYPNRGSPRYEESSTRGSKQPKTGLHQEQDQEHGGDKPTPSNHYSKRHEQLTRL